MASAFSLLVIAGCTPEFEKLEDVRGKRGSLGEEVYKTLCRRVAGTEMPNDIDGRETEVLCLHDAAAAEAELADRRDELPTRLVALAERRAQVVRAVDAVLPEGLGDELELLMRELLPFYDPPEEKLQKSTRAFADVLRKIASDPNALEGLARIARDGMLDREGSFGVYRGLLAYDELNGLFSALLPVLTQDEAVRPFFETTLVGMALELATGELDDAPDSDTRLMKDLLSRARFEFGSGRGLYVAKRDSRGMPIPTPLDGNAVPYPFVDRDQNLEPDIQGAEFVVDPNFGRTLPEPFAEISEVGVERDAQGRAYAFLSDGNVDYSRTLYQTYDADLSVLSAALREAGKLFDAQSQTAVHVAKLVPAVFGDRVPRDEVYGKAIYNYSAPNTDKSPIVDLVHASTAVLDRPLYEQSLELTQRLLEEHEPELVEALEPLLALEKRTRASGDAYPSAELAKDNVFWDQLLFEAERISRRRKTADGPTLLELLLRGALGYARNPNNGFAVERMIEPSVLKHQGALIATLLRYKDEWRNNPAGESKRAPGEPLTIGSFRTPVDRTQPDTPVTCGKDGCGGPIAGSPFERWASQGQTCMWERQRETASTSDCGQPANQSILHRSMGLIWEMAGRSQCNKTISLGDLLDFAVLKDPCAFPEMCADDLKTDEDESLGCECQANADCAGFGTDWACNTESQRCFVKLGTPSCSQLTIDQRKDREVKIGESEVQAAADYSCPKPGDAKYDPNNGCMTMPDAATYSAAFVDEDGPNAGTKPSVLPQCHLINLPDVGRSFGRALSHEFQIKIPNPWMERYLIDVAQAEDPGRIKCSEYDPDGEGPALPGSFRITDPRQPTPCVTRSAQLSRDVYTELSYEAREAAGKPQIDELGELIAFLMDDSSLFANAKDVEELRPDVAALTRVLFAPPGSSSFLMFDPLLVRGAPAECKSGDALPKCNPDDSMATKDEVCCIESLKTPPLRYRLETYYGATSFAWEHKLAFADPVTGERSSMSLLDAMKTLADGVNRTDYDETTDDPKNFEGTDFLFSTLGQVVGQHYDSPRNPLVQNTDPNRPHYRNLSNLVSYEELMADAADDGTLVVDQEAPHGGPIFDAANLPTDPSRRLGFIYHSYPLLEQLESLQIGGGDALSFSARLAELLLSPHASCAPAGGDLRVIDGKGACDMLASGVTPALACDGAAERPEGFRKPPTYRDGRATICWNDGKCFDQANACRWASPLYLALDALGGIDDRIGDNGALEDAYQGARAGLFDAYFTTGVDAAGAKQLADRRLRALVLVALEYLRERWQKESAAGTLATLGPEMVQDSVDLIRNPVFAGGLGMVEQLSANQTAMTALNRYANAILGGGVGGDGQVRAIVATLADLLEAMPGDQNLLALIHVMASSILANAAEVVQQGAAPNLHDGMIWRNLDTLREIAGKDHRRTLGRVLNNAVLLPGADTPDERPSPMFEVYDALLAINRLEPGAHGSLTSSDWAEVFNRISDVMLDDRRGFERLYQIVQCRDGSTDKVSCN